MAASVPDSVNPFASQNLLPALCIPMNVDAFVLNEAVCDSGLTRIAPITQPEYQGLRPDNTQICPDVLPPVDVFNAQPASINSRVTATETIDSATVDPTKPETVLKPPLRTNRIGVHVHWSLPRLYRAATASAEGTDPPGSNQNATSSPSFRPVPNRWLVLRAIVSSQPVTPKSVRAWVVESDRLWNVDELGSDVDLETDVSPYVNYTAGDETLPNVLNKQATVYIGSKTPADTWTETGAAVPRVPLTAMNSSNFSFPDNTMHNCNVFSMIDNLSDDDGKGNTIILNQAVCQYTVIGWHSDSSDDPLGTNPDKASLVDRLSALFLTLDLSQASTARLGTTLLPSRLVSYGTVYKVNFDRDTKPASNADQFASLFTSDVKMEPVSVGTTGLDGILSFLEAHKDNEDSISGAGADSVAKEVLSLSELLYASEDSYDSRIKASDLIYAHNFQPSSGGNSWHYDGKSPPGGAPAQPDPVTTDGNGKTEVDYLETVNDLQYQLDSATRKLQHVRWSLFAVWWKFVSDPSNSETAVPTSYETQIDTLRQDAKALTTLISDPENGLQEKIELIVRKKHGPGLPVFRPKVRSRSIPQPSFSQRRDPTLCIAGMDSGWNPRYLGTIPARFGLASEATIDSSKVGDIRVAYAIAFILKEAVSTVDHSADIGYKNWANQPWVPLFIEWEAIYFHIPVEKWSIEILNSPVGNNHAQVRYGVKENLANDPSSTADQRIVQGRIIILPQPSVNLKALVEQIIDTPGVTLSPAEQADLISNIGDLKFSSSDLSGITSNLLTVFEGSHVQPNLRIPGEANGIIPLAPAVTAGLPVGFTQDDLSTISDQTAQTPYGSMVDFSKSTTQPFKPVTHGQLRFTKLNIVDKFGQVVSAIDPKPPLANPIISDTIYPCLGDQVCPGLVEGTTNLNTVTPLGADSQLPSGYPLCPYLQLTPSINQPVRLNLDFLLPTVDANSTFTGWKVAEDWDQPVWGWVIINYADYGLQFYTADGTFYIELSFGGPTGSIATPKFIPFDPPSQPSSVVSPQLDQLITQMTGPTGPVYLTAFFDVIVAAVETMPYAPADYAAYSTSIVGKPLALVNAGVSLELASPPLESQTSLPPSNLDQTTAPSLLSYKFPIKIGDQERPYDGMVGYYDTDNTTTGVTSWTSFHTYFPAKGTSPAGDPRTAILPETYPTLTPFYVDPAGTDLRNNSYRTTLATQYLVKTMLIDPYTPFHVYSPILPIKSLQLPAWTIQKALEKISAFFRIGPYLSPTNPPKTYDATNPLTPTSFLQTQQNTTAPTQATAAIRLPIRGGKKGLWNWLQPYQVAATAAEGGEGDQGVERKYNALDVGEDDGRMRLDPGPYTAIEGFLALSQPLVKDDL